MPSARLDALASFITVARRRSFTAAAAELGVTPSAVSQSLRQLESRLGVTLLSRTTRSVALTEAGRRLFEQSAPAVAQALEAIHHVTARAGDIAGTVRLTVPDVAVPYAVTPVIPRVVARHPGISIEVQVQNWLVDIVADGFDAGIRLEESLERDMVQLRLTGPARFLVAGAPAYLEARGIPRRPQELLSHDCICYRSRPTGPLYAWELVRGKRTWRVPVQGPVATNDQTFMRSMAEAGLGLAYLFEPLALESLRARRLQPVLEEYAAEVPGFFLYYPSRSRISPAFAAFLEVLREVLAERRRPPGLLSGAERPARPG
jgi:DNA-binding transcriptional LysR family regulator